MSNILNVSAWETDEELSIDADNSAPPQRFGFEPTDEQLNEQRDALIKARPDLAPVLRVGLRYTAKYYLSSENDRNTHHADVFNQLIQIAFGVDEVIMDGHHFLFESSEAMSVHDLSKLNEMPSADTMLFDHPIMTAVFGDKAIAVMQSLAAVPVEQRDDVLRVALQTRSATVQA